MGPDLSDTTLAVFQERPTLYQCSIASAKNREFVLSYIFIGGENRSARIVYWKVLFVVNMADVFRIGAVCSCLEVDLDLDVRRRMCGGSSAFFWTKIFVSYGAED